MLHTHMLTGCRVSQLNKKELVTIVLMVLSIPGAVARDS